MTLKLPVLLTVLLFSASTFSASVLAEPHDIDPSEWMARLDGGKYLSALSIPGSHDSGSTEGGPLFADQTLSITNQLTVGVRFLDVRLTVSPHGRAPLQLAHGGTITQLQKIYFRDVVKECIAFLNAHPTETVIMSVKEENDYLAQRFESLVHDEINSYLGRFWLNDSIPTLSQARNKIVLIRRFKHDDTTTTVPLPFGMDATEWKDNERFSIRNMDIEDRYDNPGEHIKLRYVKEHIQSAVSNHKSSLFITFTSAYGNLLDSHPIKDYTDTINPELPPFLARFSGSRVGIVPMDFVDANLSWAVIKTNF
jgi:1-phosphatidylinositol phosphodiesterase